MVALGISADEILLISEKKDSFGNGVLNNETHQGFKGRDSLDKQLQSHERLSAVAEGAEKALDSTSVSTSEQYAEEKELNKYWQKLSPEKKSAILVLIK